MVNTAASGGIAGSAPDCHLKIRRYVGNDPTNGANGAVGAGEAGGKDKAANANAVPAADKNKIWVSVSGFRESSFFDGLYSIHDIEDPKDWGRGTANLYERDGYTKVIGYGSI